jgi:D-amino-acid dehydrogenase
MRVAVLGAGVIGVATAYYLARGGHLVTVIDRQPRVAQETSFANAGLIAPGHASAWASPRAPWILAKSLWRSDTALRMRLRADPALWRWNLKFLANCSRARNRANTRRKLTLCIYSRERLIELRRETSIAYDEIAKGALYLYRSPAHFEVGRRAIAMFNEYGLGLEAIDPARAVALEPALAGAQGRLAGAIYAPGDESGDCRRFTEELAHLCGTMGVVFRLGTTITRLAAEGDRVTAVHTDQGEIDADAYVLALGSYSPHLARPLGLELPIYPVKGYSLTLPLGDPAQAPMIGGVDEGYLVAFARMGNRIRLTGTADFAGYDTEHQPQHFATLIRCARELFPHAADYDRPDYWACLRPMTPDGPPILGLARHRNLYLNTGHGHMGWTMACGTSRIVADLIDGRQPELDIAGLTLERYAA